MLHRILLLTAAVISATQPVLGAAQMCPYDPDPDGGWVGSYVAGFAIEPYYGEDSVSVLGTDTKDRLSALVQVTNITNEIFKQHPKTTIEYGENTTTDSVYKPYFTYYIRFDTIADLMNQVCLYTSPANVLGRNVIKSNSVNDMIVFQVVNVVS